MRTRVRVLFTFISSIIFYWLSLKKNKPLYYSGKSLFGKSFRIGQEDSHRFKIILVVIKQVFKQQKSTNSCLQKNDNTGDSCIYDVNNESIPSRINYVKYHNAVNIKAAIIKNNLLAYNSNIFNKALDVVQVIILGIVLMPYYIYTPQKRGSIALVLQESLEILRLVSLCKKINFKRIYFFCIYEKDSNISALILQKFNIEVIKIPSEVPLAYWNKTIICDTLCVCSAYQFDEIREFSETMLFKNTEFWGPEAMLNSKDLYVGKINTPPLNTIGYYSTAGWIREMEGHIDQGIRMEENEHIVKSYLSEYLKNRNHIKLIIFLHPKEKKNKYESIVKEHYNNYFQGVDFTFSDSNKGTAELFNTINIAVAFNSTIIQERLYFGFKCIIMPLFSEGFPLKNSTINNICAKDKQDLFNKIDRNLPLTNDAFFEINQLINYRFCSKNKICVAF